jgi:hypothetical protein
MQPHMQQQWKGSSAVTCCYSECIYDLQGDNLKATIIRAVARSSSEQNSPTKTTELEPQITPSNTSFTCDYICKCFVNVNRGHWCTITLHLQGQFRHLHVTDVSNGLQPFLNVAGVSSALNRLMKTLVCPLCLLKVSGVMCHGEGSRLLRQSMFQNLELAPAGIFACWQFYGTAATSTNRLAFLDL